MSAQAITLAAVPAVPERPVVTKVHRAEDLGLSVVFGLMVLLPLLEIILRKIFHTGMSGSAAIVQHLVLILGMAGAAIAARRNDLLPLSTLDQRFSKTTADWMGVFRGGVSVAICSALAVASFQFLQTEREAAATLVYGLPVWILELAFPVGFLAIAARMALHSSHRIAGRIIALLLAAALGTAVWFSSATSLAVPCLIVLALAGLAGAPAFVLLGGTALLLFWKLDQPIASITIAHYSLVVNPTLPTLPLFTVAGYFLAEGGAPKRMINVFNAIFGSIRGGPALVTVLVCAFFTTFTGASGVTILALGGLLMPMLKDARFSDRDALGLIAGTGSIGMLLPPCLPLILYAVVARIPMEQMFLGGILPGIILVVATAAWGMLKAGKNPQQARASGHEIAMALWDAKWELSLPLVALAALMSGLATAVEAAAVTALYALITQVFIHKDLSLRRGVPQVMAECGSLIGGVLLILGVALGFTNYLVDAQISDQAMTWVTGAIHSKWVFLLVLNLFMWVIGCLMDIYSAIVVQVPLLVGLGAAYGIDPVHLGIIFLANLELGYLTPPVGLNLILASTRFKKPVPEVLRSVVPIIAVFGGVVLLITYVPWLTTALPHAFSK